jgi:hypothetical protein
MSDSLGEFFRRFDEALAKWEREQSAPSLVELVQEAGHKQPSGYAIVQAAVDWELAGFDQLPHQRPISEEDLRTLFPIYLAELEPIRSATKQEFQQGLRWALTPLRRHGSPVERCADALIDDCHKRGFDGVWVTSTSPLSSTCRPSSSSAALPGVCPGAWIALGRPGSGSVSPWVNVDTSRMGISLVAPRRASDNRVR